MAYQIKEKKIMSSRIGLEKWRYEIFNNEISIKIIYSNKILQEFEILELLGDMAHRG